MAHVRQLLVALPRPDELALNACVFRGDASRSKAFQIKLHENISRKHLRCNLDVCPCRTLQRPGDIHGDDVVDDVSGDALFGCTDAGGAFAHAVAHVLVMSRMLMSPSASSPSSTS